MASVRVPCPSCQASLRAPLKHAGRKAWCRKCGAKFRLPKTLGEAAASAAQAAPEPEGEDFVGLLVDERTAPERTGEPRPPEAKAAPTPHAYHARHSRDFMKVVILLMVLAGAAGGVTGAVWKRWNQRTELAGAEQRDHNGVSPSGSDAAKTESSVAKGAAESPREPFASARRPLLGLPRGQVISFQPIGAKPEGVQGPEGVLAVEAAFPSVRRVFPPLRPDADPAILWQSAPGFQGFGEKLTLDLFSPQTGRRVNRLIVDGDNSPTPLCDFSVDAGLFALAHGKTGKVWVWNTRDGRKILDAFEPYAGKPEHHQAGLAAIYLTEPPDRLVTVSTAGAVHLWDVASKKLLGEYVPPEVKPGSIAAGKNVCSGPGRQSIVLLAGGTLYKVEVRPKVAGSAVAELGGEFTQALGLAASGDGRAVFALETETKGKLEKAVMALGPDGNHTFYRWPENIGDPISAGWCGDDLATVATSRGGAVWFEAEGKTFRPLALVTTPGDRAIHVAAESHWSLLPDPADPKLSVLVEYAEPQRGLVDPLAAGSKRPAPTLRLDDKGLFK